MNSVVLLDGGMGQELLKRSSKPPSPLWSAQVMLDEPHIVEAVHSAYLDAGATVITLNAYSATPERLARDADEGMFESLQSAACKAAKSAIAKSNAEASIGGCLPPLKASYRPDLNTDEEAVYSTYQRICETQIECVDVFQAETMSSVLEVRAATRAANETGKPAWIAMSLKDGADCELRSGEPLAAGIEAAVENGADAILVNCSWPETTDAAMDQLAASGLPFGAYANGFTSIDALKPGGTVDKLEARTDLTPQVYGDFAMGWLDKGATIIGGCCEVGPEHISHLNERINSAGFEIRPV